MRKLDVDVTGLYTVGGGLGGTSPHSTAFILKSMVWGVVTGLTETLSCSTAGSNSDKHTHHIELLVSLRGST